MHGDDVGHRLAQIVVDAPPETDGAHDRPEIVVQQHKRRCFARHIGAASAHGDADIGRLERRRVIHAVPGHRNHGAMRLECLDDAQLLRRHDAGEDADAGDGRRKLGLAHALNRRAVQHILALKPGLARDRAGRDGIIAGDHDHADARRLAFADSGGNGGAQRIGEPRQAEQRERKAAAAFPAAELRPSLRQPPERACRPRPDGRLRLPGRAAPRHRGRRVRRWLPARPWRRPDMARPPALPYLRYGQQIGLQPIDARKRQPGRRTVRAAGQIMKRTIHGIVGIRRTGQRSRDRQPPKWPARAPRTARVQRSRRPHARRRPSCGFR